MIRIQEVNRRRQILEFLFHWITPFFNPILAMHAVLGLRRYVKDWVSYSRLAKADTLFILDSHPQLHDWSVTTGFDAHYFYMSGWAMRSILCEAPERHIDVGSHNIFVNLLSAVVPVTFVDIRPLCADVPDLNCLSGSVLSMPFEDSTVKSLSCLHVAEHIGLGRYGDPLDPDGTAKAAKELARILAPGGNLFFAVPIGKSRICFNAHRVISPHEILEMFGGLELVEVSAVDDRGNFNPNVRIEEYSSCRYACGLFWFRKRATR